MSATRRDPALPSRLAHLRGDGPPCCVPEYEDLAGKVRRSAGFAASLKRVKALADENRFLAVSLLERRRELCACEIQAATGLTHATVSHHMGVLVEAGIVKARRAGKWMFYRLADGAEVRSA